MNFKGLAPYTAPFEFASILIKVHPCQVVVTRLRALQFNRAKFRPINGRDGYFLAKIINFDINHPAIRQSATLLEFVS